MPKPLDISLSRSRRHFLTAAGAAGLWPAVASAQHITANPTPPSGQDSASGETPSLAARTDSASHLTVPVLINGKGPFNFVVDTGAERSVIADSLAETLGLPQAHNVTVQGIINLVTVTSVHADVVSFGPFVRKNLLLPVLPRATLAADGFLGLDVIDGSRVTFDFKGHAVRIDQPRYYMAPDNPATTTRLNAEGRAGRLQIVDCVVDNVSCAAFIDTGAEVSVGNTALLERLKAQRKVAFDDRSIMLTGVTGGEMLGQVVPVSRIRLQDLSFTDGVLAIADVPDFDAWKLHTQPAVLIGMNYLRQFTSVSVDYRAKEIRFELSQVPPNPRPGVELHAIA